jgi:rhodanese-related sulfurtransferase
MSRVKGELSDDLSIDVPALRQALDKKEHVVVVSIDERDVFKQSHIDGSINIPFDELETRMDDELKPEERIIIYEQNRQTYGYEAFEILKNNGFKNVSILRGGFEEWKQSLGR